ncbi:MAG TPA: hypothetical protein EYP28_06545 [Methanophagales archaeon]|nr:hypothetical protein [Methanophagales archaeon]
MHEMKKKKMKEVSILVTVSMVALIFAAAGIASAVTFKQTSTVIGDGVIAVHEELTAGNLKTQFTQHGCGNYNVEQVVDYKLEPVMNESYKFYPKKAQNASITFKEEATLTFIPETLQLGMTIPGDVLKFKEELCIKNYQIGAAMRERYLYVDTLTKETESELVCEPACCVDENEDGINETAIYGFGIAELNTKSQVSGAAHIGVLLKKPEDPHVTLVRVSDDYTGTFEIVKWLEIKDAKKLKCPEDNETVYGWLDCPSICPQPETYWEWCPGDCP